jgi:hypothetical protein
MARDHLIINHSWFSPPILASRAVTGMPGQVP